MNLGTYLQEAGLPEASAKDQVSRAFQLVIQVSRARMGRRVIASIDEVEPVREGSEHRMQTLFAFDPVTEAFVAGSGITPGLARRWARFGVTWQV